MPPCPRLRLSLLARHLAQVPAAADGGDFAAVAAAMTHYFEGAHDVQPERTRSIWHTEVASLKGVDPSGELVVTEPAPYLAMIASGACGSNDTAVLAADRLVSLEFPSSRACLARVEVSDPLDQAGKATVYTDFISLVDIVDRGWTVVSKLFAGRPLGTLSYSEPALSTTHGEIAVALQHYFDGQRSGAGSSTIMRRVFHPGALLRGPVMECDANDHPGLKVGELRVLTADDFFAMLDAPDFPKWDDKGLNKILRIDKSGPRSACATVQIQAADMLYTDHLSMLKLGPEGRAKWMIVHKTFVPSAIE